MRCIINASNGTVLKRLEDNAELERALQMSCLETTCAENGTQVAATDGDFGRCKETNWREKVVYQAIENSNRDGWSTMYSWNGSWMLMRRLEGWQDVAGKRASSG